MTTISITVTLPIISPNAHVTTTMRIRAKVTPDRFSSLVFGGDWFISKCPTLFTTGIDVEYYPPTKKYYIVGEPGRGLDGYSFLASTTFFTKKELRQCFDILEVY